MGDGNLPIESVSAESPARAEGGWLRPGLEVVPDHELMRRIGRGSYGEVWLARNTMGVYRAVKIVSRSSFKEQVPFEREWSGIRKFEPISRSHEGFVDVLHVGLNEERGYFYYVMELADDQSTGASLVHPESYSPKTLAKEIQGRGRLPVQDCLALGLALSLALAELHKRGLVHRDIKPSNIVFVNGVPKLADIGLVTDASEARSYVGTEGFIPPEGPGLPQADVYGLGKVLYECSTGKDRQEFPDLPTQWDNSPDQEMVAELNVIVLKACRARPEERYRSAWEMHSHLVVLANGKSVRRLTSLERTLGNLKRLGLSLGVLGLVLLPVVSLIYREYQRTREQRQQQIGAEVAYGNRAMESGDLLGALSHFAAAMQLESGSGRSVADQRMRFESTLGQCPKLAQVIMAEKEIIDVQFGRGGQRLVCAQYFGKAQLYEVGTGSPWGGAFGPSQELCAVGWSPDGSQIVTASEAHTAQIWDALRQKEERALAHPDKVNSAKFSPDGKHVVTACHDGIVRMWAAANGELERSFAGHSNAVLFAAFSPDGRWIASGSTDGTARLWEVGTGRSFGPSLRHPSWVVYADFSPDTRKVVTACVDNRARVWQTGTGQRILPDLVHRDEVRSAVFSPDGRLILTGCFDGTARLWDSETLQPCEGMPILRQGDRVNCACFDPSGRLVASAGADGSVLVWDLAGTVRLPVAASAGFGLSQDGKRFVTVSNSTVRVSETTTGRAISPSVGVADEVEKAELTADGAYVLVISRAKAGRGETNRLVQVLEASTGRPVGPGVGVQGAAGGVLCSQDGQRLATWTGGEAQVWDVRQGKRIGGLPAHKSGIDSGCFSPDGNRLATASGNRVEVFNVLDGSACFGALTHPLWVARVVFSPDGQRLATCCWDQQLSKGFAQVWEAGTGKPVGPRLGHRDGVIHVGFSPDGSRVVTCSEDFTAMVWEVASGKPITAPLQHQNQVMAAAFSLDGRWVVTASGDRTARVWSSTTGDPLTPPLRHSKPLEQASFFADGRRVLTVDSEGKRWTWDLPMEPLPEEDTGRLGNLLSGVRDLAGAEDRTQRVTIRQVWQELRERYPGWFNSSREQIAAWEEAQGAACEAEERWQAAVFHWRQLVQRRPGDRRLREHLSQLENRIAKGD